MDAIANTVRSTHGFALLMAAIMHDYRHPGVRDKPRDSPATTLYCDRSWCCFRMYFAIVGHVFTMVYILLRPPVFEL